MSQTKEKNCMNCAYCKNIARFQIVGDGRYIDDVPEMDDEYACSRIINDDVIIRIIGQDPEKMVCKGWKKDEEK